MKFECTAKTAKPFLTERRGGARMGLKLFLKWHTLFSTQRRKGAKNAEKRSFSAFFAPLRLCVEKSVFLFILVCFFGLLGSLQAEESYKSVPVSYKGRVMPLEVYAKLHFQEFYGKMQIKKEHAQAFHQDDPSALTFLFNYYLYGHTQFDDSPLFQIHHAEVKKILGFDLKKSHFSYHQLENAIYQNEESNLTLMRLLIPYFFDPTKNRKQEIKQLTPGLFVELIDLQLTVALAPHSPPWNFLTPGFVLSDEMTKKTKPLVDEALNLLSLMNSYKNSNLKSSSYENSFKALKDRQTSPKEIAVLLETEHPLNKRLETAGSLFKVLPLKRAQGFVSLDALALKIFDSKTESLKPVGNFTSYSDQDFNQIQEAYFDFKSSHKFEELGSALNHAYGSIAGNPAKEAFNKTIKYPTKWQLQAEVIYYHYPILEIAIFLYAIALTGLILGVTLQKHSITLFALSTVTISFILHTFILALRVFILNRPPVSNMFETVIYVPWIAMIAGFIFYSRFKNSILLIASCISTLLLLILLEVTGMNNSLENVQAVLDSQYWLIIHVMAVVGSYGVFFLSGVLAFIYLVQYLLLRKESEQMKFLTQFVLQTMYLGVILLIPGTILGGIWAAESWGRFWDWDPKESWAFISSCIYLIVIHAYRFHKISSFGLTVGSVVGLLAISFTWYGVNYILGTGLHSYGFGSGGEIYYYIFLLSQLIFLTIVSLMHKNNLEMKSKNVV